MIYLELSSYFQKLNPEWKSPSTGNGTQIQLNSVLELSDPDALCQEQASAEACRRSEERGNVWKAWGCAQESSGPAILKYKVELILTILQQDYAFTFFSC